MKLPCDFRGCAATTDLYAPFPACVSCQNATCPAHQIPGTLTEPDQDQPATYYCLDCADYVPKVNA